MDTVIGLTVELAQFYNHRFAGWQSFEGFTSKREAWEFIKSHGLTAADQGDKWMVSEQVLTARARMFSNENGWAT